MIKPNDYFDEIFVLSLERRYDRWRKLNERLIREGIFVKKFEGIDKKTPFVKNEYKRFLSKHKNNWSWSDGNHAILKSFYRLYLHIEQNYKDIDKILIFEDDVLFHKDFNKLFDVSVRKIPNDWRIWYLGGSYWSKSHISLINGLPFTKAKSITGNFAIALRKKMIPEILSLLFSTMNKGCLTTDIAIKQKYEMKDGIYVSEPLLCAHDYGFSDTEDRVFTEKSWGHSKKIGRYCDLETYH